MSNPTNERFRGLIDETQGSDIEWMLDTTANQKLLRLVFGYMTAVAVEHQNWTYWQVLHETRTKCSQSFKMVS